jgi:molecular chaperone GrpE (heat shock protein)
MKPIPGYHYIVDVVERKDLEDETIVEELKKGYLWKNEVLRKAEVISVKNK